MPKAPSLEQQLAELAALAAADSPERRLGLTRALSGRVNLLAARAAAIVAQSKLDDFIPNLLWAYERFFAAGLDKGCFAKLALADALYTLGYREAEPFLRGIHHIQKEPTYGGQVDVAPTLRGTCALALARLNYRDLPLELAVLLMDEEQQARLLAVRAAIYSQREDLCPLLRMKLLAGDSDNDVIAEGLAGLMQLTPAKSLEFVAGFMDADDDAVAESAALALGGSRYPPALERLVEQWRGRLLNERRRPLLLAIALTRQPEAVEFLLQRVADDQRVAAADAVAALGIYKHDTGVRKQVVDAVELRDLSDLQLALAAAFD